jgi:hypothetical protein
MFPRATGLRLRLIGIAAFLSLGTLCQAQFNSNVQGTVTDSTGAVVPRVVVTLHNAGTGIDLKATTNATGYYRFNSVPPGSYTVIATQAGFDTSSISVTVTADETRGVDITLITARAGTVSVTVTGVASDLNLEETRIQTTLPSDEITKLPLAGHDVQQLIALTPGVTGFENVNPAGGYGATLFAGSFAPPFQSNGQGTNGNLYLIDDLPVSDDINQGGAIMLPNGDMIDTVSLQTQTYSVENGTSASLQTSFSTKSGANKFHGDVDYTYASSNIGAAENVINTITSPPTGKPYGTPSGVVNPFHQNQILGSVGGPILKDRTFFFFSLQRQNSGIGNVGATGQDNWDPAFIAWGLTAFPDSGMAKAMSLAPNTRDTPGPKYAVKVASTLDTGCGGPQTTASGLTYNLPCDTPMYDHGQIFNQAQPFDGTQFSIRLDQSFRNGDRVYAMFERIHQTLGDLADRPALDSTTPSTNKYASINWIHVFSPKLLNEVHGGNLREVSGQILSNSVVAGSIPYGDIGLDTTDGYQFWDPFGGMPFSPDNQLEHLYNLRDTLSYNFLNHTLRGGYQFTREDYLENQQVYGRGGFGFNITDAFSLLSNSSNFNWYLFSVSGLTGEYQPQLYGATSIYNGIWIDDTWKVRPNLTITAGFRYDDFGNPSPYSNSGAFAPLFPGAGSDFHAQALNTTTHVSGNAFTQSQNHNFQPRAGFAYTPYRSRELSIHGGIGLYENALTPAQIANNLPTQPPVRISLSESTPLPFGDFTTTTAPWGNTYSNQLPFPVYGQDPSGNVYSNPSHTAIYQVNLNGFSPTVKPEKFLLFSLGIEQQLPANLVFGLTYSGSHGYDLIVGAVGQGPNGVNNADFNLKTGVVGSNRAAPEWGQLRYSVNGGTSSNFSAMIVTLKQHYKGLSYQANYNWERALQWAPTFSDSEYGQVAFWPAVYDAKVYYGPSSIDITNSFSLGGSYEVPRLRTDQRLLNEAVSGWRLSTITVAQGGTPFSVGNTGGPSYAFDNSIKFDGGAGGTPAFPTPSAGLVRRGFSRTAVSQTGVFTGATFTDPAGAGTEPVLSRQGANTFRNPGFFNVNAGFAKAFAVPFIRSEPAKLTLRGDFINLLNRTNWGAIANDIADTPNFGFSTSTQNKRYLQLGGRFEF